MKPVKPFFFSQEKRISRSKLKFKLKEMIKYNRRKWRINPADEDK